MYWYLKVLRKYAVFTGRARRKEFWMFCLYSTVMLLIVHNIGNERISDIYEWAVVIPSYALFVRRMHDIGRSGWWVFVPIANIIFSFEEGTRGKNKYGPDPKDELEPL